MELYTTSAIISLYGELEEQSARFYEGLADNPLSSDLKELFLSFARENKKNRDMLVRAYREVITDAVEACFSFSGLNESDYTFKKSVVDLSYLDMLRRAIEIEEKTYNFCVVVSNKSRDLLADISYAFKRVAKRKAPRIQKMRLLLEKRIKG